MNETIHDEENSSETKDNSIHDEYDTSEDENKTEIETYEDFGEKIHETEESIPTETSQVLTVFNKVIHHEDDSSDDKSEGLITYSTDQQIFKFKVNSWGVNIYLHYMKLKCTIDAILQHIGF